MCDRCWKSGETVVGYPYSSVLFETYVDLGSEIFNLPLAFYEEEEEMLYIVLSMSNSINVASYNPFGDILG